MILKNYTFHVILCSISDVSSCVFSATSTEISTSWSVFLIWTWTCFLTLPCLETCHASWILCHCLRILRIVSVSDSSCLYHVILIWRRTRSGIVSASSSCSSPCPDHFSRTFLTSEENPPQSLAPPSPSLSCAASSCSAPPARRSSSQP